jgi:hypothetical protein
MINSQSMDTHTPAKERAMTQTKKITAATLDGKNMASNLAFNAINWNQVDDLEITESGYRGTIAGLIFIAS